MLDSLSAALDGSPEQLSTFLSFLPSERAELPPSAVDGLFGSLGAPAALHALAWLSSTDSPVFSESSLSSTLSRVSAACAAPDSVPAASQASFLSLASSLLPLSSGVEVASCAASLHRFREAAGLPESLFSDYLCVCALASAGDARGVRALLDARRSAGGRVGAHHRAALAEALARAGAACEGVEVLREDEESLLLARGYALRVVAELAAQDGDGAGVAAARQLAREAGVALGPAAAPEKGGIGETGEGDWAKADEEEGRRLAEALKDITGEDAFETDEEMVARWEKENPGLREHVIMAYEFSEYIAKFEKMEMTDEKLDEMMPLN